MPSKKDSYIRIFNILWICLLEFLKLIKEWIYNSSYKAFICLTLSVQKLRHVCSGDRWLEMAKNAHLYMQCMYKGKKTHHLELWITTWSGFNSEIWTCSLGSWLSLTWNLIKLNSFISSKQQACVMDAHNQHI